MRLQGKLVGENIRDYSGFRVTAVFEERVPISGADEDVPVRSRRESVAERDGGFGFEIPEADQRRGPIELTATGPAGLRAGTSTVPAHGPFDDVVVEVAVEPPTPVVPNPDITLGEQLKFTGRAIDRKGQAVPADLLVVIWGRRPGGPASPVAVTRTGTGGYFSGPWPGEQFIDAYAAVGGGEPIALLLEQDRIPLRIILVVPAVPEQKPDKPDDCGCPEPAPPLGADQVDQVTNPEAFATDPERCVDFTIPDRTVAEVSYHAVVRTTQPELRGTAPLVANPIPQSLIERLGELAGLQPVLDDPRPGAQTPPVTQGPYGGPGHSPGALQPINGPSVGDAVTVAALGAARRFMPGIDLDGRFLADALTREAVAARVLEARRLEGEPLRLEASVLSELARDPGGITPLRLVEAEHTSVVRNFRTSVSLLATPTTGRFDLTDDHQIDWDLIPEDYQASTIAHGHLLTLKQVWRAAGYSQGDLLYSLPLAPGQQKLVSILDWDRDEVYSRRAERIETEELEADLFHDQAVSDIVRTTLTESMEASSRADTRSFGAGVAGFIGPVVFGAAGGVSSAGSTASQTSARSVTGLALNRVRDRTLQAASAVRNQRATVVQTGRQGEAVRAQTEVVANYNHCHALTISYFEVLQHYQVSQELAAVQECLFVPFAITPFNTDRALRWRRPLQLAARRPRLREGFDALERVHTGWADAGYPAGRYADELLTHVDGEFEISALIPRPADDDEDDFVEANWAGYEDDGLLWDSALSIWTRYLGIALPEDRDRIWDTRIAPTIVQRLLDKLIVAVKEEVGPSFRFSVDPTVVDSFAQGRPMTVAIRVDTPLPERTRAQVEMVNMWMEVTNLPPGAELLIHSGTLRYRTEHMTHHFFMNRRILNDLTLGDAVSIPTPLTTEEKTDPKERDQRNAQRLLDHLNEHVEHYHRAIWLTMDPNRRYLLLDGFVAPDAGGRSVASVVENRVIGVVGNCLVMPVAPGFQLDVTYRYADVDSRDLRHLYAGDDAPPMRISVPTSGVVAEAVMGRCNSCEVIDDTRFWRWEEAPIPDLPPPISPLSTDTRRTAPPSLAPDQFPEPLVGYQQVPEAPAPTGLAAAMEALGTSNIFRDLTGLALNQQNAAQALKTSLTAAQGFATQAASLAQQQFLNRELDRSLGHVKDARDKQLITPEQASSLTESVLRGAIGETRPSDRSALHSPEMQRVMGLVPGSTNGLVRVVRPEGSVTITSGSGASPLIDVTIYPDVIPIRQPSNLTCWAAAGTMMQSWRTRQALTIEGMLDGLGDEWRQRFDANEGLTVAELRSFAAALGLVEESVGSYTPEGLAQLLAAKGPLLEVGDDAIDDNLVVHLRIITAVRGDGTATGTNVTMADSASGTLCVQPFTEFDRRHNSADAVAYGMGMLHF